MEHATSLIAFLGGLVIGFGGGIAVCLVMLFAALDFPTPHTEGDGQ